MTPIRRLTPLIASAAVLALAACGDNPTAPTPTPAPDAAAPATPPPPAAADANRLTPLGWGPLRIGMTRAEVEAAVGGPAPGVSAAEPEQCIEFRPQRAPQPVLVMVEQGRLTRISLTSPSEITTEQGFRVGDQGAAVKTALGATAVVEPHKYESAPAEYVTLWSVGGGRGYIEDADARGLVFEVGTDGVVKAIRAGGPSIQYVEGCS